MLSNLSGWHFLIILFVVLLLFGAPKLPGLARSLGQSMKIFKSEISNDDAGRDTDAHDTAAHDTAARDTDARDTADRTRDENVSGSRGSSRVVAPTDPTTKL